LDFAADAQKFVRMFGAMISQSTPHLYLSALPFSPESSIIYRKFSGEFSQVIGITSGHMTAWPTCQSVLQGHTSSVMSIAFSPDGKHTISGSVDRTICIWDAETGKVLGVLLGGHKAPVQSVAYSPDGKQIISGSNDATICIWDVETCKAVAVLQGHTCVVASVAFSPDGKHIISGSFDKTICIWDAETGKTVARLEGHTDLVESVAYSPDGKHIISGSHDTTIQIWDAMTNKAVAVLLGHKAPVCSVTFSPDGKYIISGSSDNPIHIWDVETGKSVAVLKGHTDSVSSVAISPDGQYIISGSEDKTIRIWDAVTGKPVAVPLKGHTDQVTSVLFSPDGKHIISGSSDKTIQIWNVDIGKAVATTPEDIWQAFKIPPINPLFDVQSLFEDTVEIFNDCRDSIQIQEDGWILGPQARLLLYVPHICLTGLVGPRTKCVIGIVPTELDFSHFAHGHSWQHCYQGNPRSYRDNLFGGGLYFLIYTTTESLIAGIANHLAPLSSWVPSMSKTSISAFHIDQHIGVIGESASTQRLDIQKRPRDSNEDEDECFRPTSRIHSSSASLSGPSHSF
jgi:WD40 repeat protein